MKGNRREYQMVIQKKVLSSNTTYFCSFGISSEELKTKRLSYTEIQMLKDESLHFPDFAFAVRVVRDVNEVIDFWAIHFFIF